MRNVKKGVRSDKPRYVVYAPSFDDSSGGVIWLHALVDSLNRIGEEAFIFPKAPDPHGGMRDRLTRPLRGLRFSVSPGYLTPIAGRRDLNENTIAVYPETVSGNPLGAKNVVRWLLYKPGVLCPFVPYPGEMYFKAGNFSDAVHVTGGAPTLSLWRRNPVFRDLGYPDRKGSCFMLRKGHGKTIIHDTRESIQLDGRSHEYITDIFNRCEVFYCYDEFTMYSQYAAICGCISVVVPGFFRSHADYVKSRPIARYGLSYGLEEMEHARSTMHLVNGVLEEMERQSHHSVLAFVDKTKRCFGFRSSCADP